MRKKYHGTVHANGKAVYEKWYETRRQAVTDLQQEARETVLNSFGEDTNAGFILSCDHTVIENRDIPKRRLPGRYAGPASSVYGLLPLGGTRIC
jgi:hypothetical protein